MLLLLLVLGARADVIMNPPEDCPRGSQGRSGHIGTWCEAGTCAREGACPEGQVCETVALCVDTRESPCGGRPQFDGEVCTFVKHEALGPCDGDGRCAQGVCEAVPRCVPPTLLDRACGGCALAGMAPGFALFGFRRRRQAGAGGSSSLP